MVTRLFGGVNLPSGAELGPDMSTLVRNATGKDKERTVYKSLRAVAARLWQIPSQK
jgi:hypothetical protein